MSDDLRQALDFLRAERQREQETLSVNIHTGHGTEHVWTLLDHIAALEARLEALDRDIEIDEPIPYEPNGQHTIKVRLSKIEHGEPSVLVSMTADEVREEARQQALADVAAAGAKLRTMINSVIDDTPMMDFVSAYECWGEFEAALDAYAAGEGE